MKKQKIPGENGGPTPGCSPPKPYNYSSPSSSSLRNNLPSDQQKQQQPQPQQQQQQHNSINARDKPATPVSDCPPPSSANPTSPNPVAPPQPNIRPPPHIIHPRALAASSSASRAIPPPPPDYGFHMLERRTIVLADGSVRSYFALPSDLDPYAAAAAGIPRPDLDPYAAAAAGIPRPDLNHSVGGPLGYDDRRFPHRVPLLNAHVGVGHADRLSPENVREPLRPPYGPGGGHQQDYWSSLGLDGPMSQPLKRKYTDEDDEYVRRRNQQHVLQYGTSEESNPNLDRLDYMGRSPGGHFSKHSKLGGSPGHDVQLSHDDSDNALPPSFDVDPQALKRAFLRFSKSINECSKQKRNYLDDGRHARLTCLACGRSSKEFNDMHGLIMHTYGSKNADLLVDHLGLHKALCVLMEWNYSQPPNDSKAYRSFSAEAAAENKEDLILWPPSVIIHNTITGRKKDGRMEGIGNREMENKLKELGFSAGKTKAMYGKDGHMGMSIVKFANTQTGLKEAEEFAEFFKIDGHGRSDWVNAHVGADVDQNPNFFMVDEKTGEKKYIFFGYLAIASDLDKIDYDTRKKAVLKSKGNFDL